MTRSLREELTQYIQSLTDFEDRVRLSAAMNGSREASIEIYQHVIKHLVLRLTEPDKHPLSREEVYMVFVAANLDSFLAGKDKTLAHSFNLQPRRGRPLERSSLDNMLIALHLHRQTSAGVKHEAALANTRDKFGLESTHRVRRIYDDFVKPANLTPSLLDVLVRAADAELDALDAV